MAFDASQIRDVSRALNKVRTVAQAAAAARSAIDAGNQLMARAEDLPDLFRGAASGTAIRRQLGSDVAELQSEAARMDAPSLAAQPVGTGWDALRRKIERVYVDGSAVFASEDTNVSLWGALVGNLEQSIVRYGKVIEQKGVIGGAGQIIGDTASAAGSGLKNVETGVGEGAKKVGEGAGDVLGDLLAGWWPVIIAAGAVGALYVFGPALAARAVAR